MGSCVVFDKEISCRQPTALQGATGSRVSVGAGAWGGVWGCGGHKEPELTPFCPLVSWKPERASVWGCSPLRPAFGSCRKAGKGRPGDRGRKPWLRCPSHTAERSKHGEASKPLVYAITDSNIHKEQKSKGNKELWGDTGYFTSSSHKQITWKWWEHQKSSWYNQSSID